MATNCFPAEVWVVVGRDVALGLCMLLLSFHEDERCSCANGCSCHGLWYNRKLVDEHAVLMLIFVKAELLDVCSMTIRLTSSVGGEHLSGSW